jgi:predicted enzyme related to lactoylglutathione lyase
MASREERVVHGVDIHKAAAGDCLPVLQSAAAVTANGGRGVMQKTTIAGVGHRIFVEDTEGNIVGAMQYDTSAD